MQLSLSMKIKKLFVRKLITIFILYFSSNRERKKHFNSNLILPVGLETVEYCTVPVILQGWGRGWLRTARKENLMRTGGTTTSELSWRILLLDRAVHAGNSRAVQTARAAQLDHRGCWLLRLCLMLLMYWCWDSLMLWRGWRGCVKMSLVKTVQLFLLMLKLHLMLHMLLLV